MTSLEEARQALDRAVEEIRSIEIPDPKNHRLVERAARAAFGGVCRLIALIQKNLHLARAAEESSSDYRREEARLHAEERSALLRLRRIRNAIVAKCQSLDPSVQVTDQTDGSKLVSGFDEFLEKGLKKLGQDDSFFSSGKHKATERLWNVLDYVDEHEPRLDRWKEGCRASSMNLGQLRRARHVLDESSPGKRWLRLVDVPVAANPPEGPQLWLSESNSWEPPALGPLYKLVHHQRFLDEPECRRACDWLSDLRTSLHAVASDFHARLGRRASIAWILERYARRCRRLRRNELREMLEELAPTEKRELALTRDAAVFLFDHGFEVLTEQSEGTHRYDIIGDQLLVEAKIYDGRRRGLAAVAEGLSQIHQYANTLADGGVHVEPVLLVFRLGGPRATPVLEYKIGNLPVTIAHVDLGTSVDSGSNSPPPEPDITEAIIAAKLARMTSAPGRRTKKGHRGG